MNHVVLIGNLGSDPEFKQTEGGHSRCRLSVATNRRWTNQAGEKQEETTWHNVIAWGKLADTASQYLAKGRQVAVEGRIRNYSVGEGEEKKYYTEVVASGIEFLGSKNGNGNAAPPDDPNEDPPF